MAAARANAATQTFFARIKRSTLPFCAFLSAASIVSTAGAADFNCPKSHSYLLMNASLFKQGQSGALGRPLRILAIGSSSTEGVGSSSPKFTYPQQLKNDLTKTWGISTDIVNAGIGGETIDATIVRLRAALNNDHPNLVIWQVGTNDAVSGGDEAHFRKVLQEGIDTVARAKAELVLLDPQYMPSMKSNARYQAFIDDIALYGLKDKVPVFSRYAMMKAWVAGSSSDILSSMLYKDHFHMSDRGYGCLAQRLAGDLANQWGKNVHLIGADDGSPMLQVMAKGPTQAVAVLPKE